MALFANLSRSTRLTVGLAVPLLGAFAAHAGIASVDQRVTPSPPPVAATGYEADDHFPGAALLLAAEPMSRGTTGTAPLPPLPAMARLADVTATDGSVAPAPRFQPRGSALDRARALRCLTDAVYYEAANEPDAGQRAVAQVVLNRVRHPAFPATVCGVVFQGADMPVCQFSFACDGAMGRARAPAAWNRARRVAARALAGEVFAPVGLATHYHTYAVTPTWNRTLVMTGAFGAHFFHRWKGWWGTPAAFRDRYAGGEPRPGAGPAEAVLPVVNPVVGATATLAAAPALVHESVPSPAATPASPTLPESQILDRWKDSGQPLR